MLNRDTLGALIFLAFFTAYAVFAWQIPLLPFEEMDAVNSASIPKVYAVLGLIFSLLALLAQAIKRQHNSGDGWPQINRKSIGQTAVLLLLMWVYTALLEPIGFLLATSVFLSAGFFIMGERRWRVLLLASVPVAVVFWLIVTKLLGIYLVPGELWS